MNRRRLVYCDVGQMINLITDRLCRCRLDTDSSSEDVTNNEDDSVTDYDHDG